MKESCAYVKVYLVRATVVAQLVEQSHPTEICSSNPGISKILTTGKDKNKENEMVHSNCI